MSTKIAKSRKPEINISLNGYDCTGHPQDISGTDLEMLARVFRHASVLFLRKQHGAIECPGLVSIGLDFGGPFDEKTGLPIVKKYRRKRGKR